MISEYLSEELCMLLEKHLNLPALTHSSNQESKEPPSKRQKMSSEPLEDYSKDQPLNSATKVNQVYSSLDLSFYYFDLILSRRKLKYRPNRKH